MLSIPWNTMDGSNVKSTVSTMIVIETQIRIRKRNGAI
jgi:hypothetical protein